MKPTTDSDLKPATPRGWRTLDRWLEGETKSAKNDVQQRADSGTKSGLNRTPLDDQKVIKVNDLAAFGLLATDQKVRSSNLFGRAILSMT